MSVHARAPTRIDFAGGWTDVPAFAEREGGAVVNAAITLSVHVDFLLGGQKIKLIAEDLAEHAIFASSGSMAYDGKLDLHKAALNMLPVTGGIEILSHSDAPGGSGLGASGALDVALVAGLSHCRGEPYSPEELAELGFELEAQELKLLGGRQDQYAAALGSFHALSFTESGVQTRHLDVNDEAARDLEAHMLLVYTGHSHFSHATHDRVWTAFGEGDPTVREALAIIRDLPTDASAALEAGDWRRLAKVMDDNWIQQRRLHPTISTPKTARIEDAARNAGAWGLKATGAGAGGCMVILCAPDRRSEVADGVEAAGGQLLEAGFASEGVTVWEREDADHDA